VSDQKRISLDVEQLARGYGLEPPVKARLKGSAGHELRLVIEEFGYLEDVRGTAVGPPPNQ
jgi:hypothetical protein